MKSAKITALLVSSLLIVSLFAGCGQVPDSERIVEVEPDESGFSAVFVDDKMTSYSTIVLLEQKQLIKLKTQLSRRNLAQKANF